MSGARLLVFGATGLTGGLVVEALRARGVAPVVAGRNEKKLRALAHRLVLRDDDIEVVEPDDPSALVRAVERARVVVACAGPFVHVGEPVVAACATHGVHYVDAAGEAVFVRTMARRYEATARESRAALAPSMAFEVAPADAAAARAADGLEGPVDLDVVYAVANFAPSNGTRASAFAMASMPSLAVEQGALREEPIAAKVIDVALRAPFENTRAFSAPSPELVTIPRHVRVRTLRTFLASKRAGWMPVLARGVPIASKLATPFVRQLLEQRLGPGPSREKLALARFQIVADARSVDGKRRRRVTVTGSDIYRFSAALLADAAIRLRDASPAPEGLIAPSQLLGVEGIFEHVRAFEGGAIHVEEWWEGRFST
jgi:short subunit dehydrogenase-like uncharacterized protein